MMMHVSRARRCVERNETMRRRTGTAAVSNGPGSAEQRYALRRVRDKKVEGKPC
jgi:hypothetical protein